jgi:hypothetical protein
VSVHKVYIIDGATDAPVEVELHDDLKVDVLLDVESQWASTRHDIRTKLTTLAVPPQSRPESLHWDWGRKSLPLAFRDPDDFRIMAVGRQTVWEAAVVTLCKNQVALLAPHAGSPLVYVDYLEVAPWNWKIENVQTRKFKAIGSVLLRAAIEQSYTKGWEGRVGLHALPQAATFYVNQGLQFVKNDPNKQNLPYYELSAAEAFKRTGRR